MRRTVAALVVALFVYPWQAQGQVLKGRHADRAMVVTISDAWAQNASYQAPNLGLAYKIGWEKVGLAPYFSGHSLGIGAYVGKGRGLFAGLGWKFWGHDRRTDSQEAEGLALTVGFFDTHRQSKREVDKPRRWTVGGFLDVAGEIDRGEKPRVLISRDVVGLKLDEILSLQAGPYASTGGFGGLGTVGLENFAFQVRLGAGGGLSWDGNPQVVAVVGLGW